MGKSKVRGTETSVGPLLGIQSSNIARGGATELKVGSRQVSKLQVFFSSSTYGCLATYKRGSLL